jgi:hypothetical protein
VSIDKLCPLRPSITFLYPSRCIGGAQLLFARLAEEIASKKLGRVSIVDYEDGFIRSYLKNCSSVTFIQYIESKTELKDTTVVVPLSHLVELRYMLTRSSLNCNYLFWSIHPDNIKHILYGTGRRCFWKKERARALLNSLSNQGHIIFMDEANQRACKKEVGDFHCTNFMQIPISIVSPLKFRVRKIRDEVALAWLGRVAYDKINSLKKIIKDISISQCQVKIKLHIIGSGSKEKELQDFAAIHGVQLHCAGVLQGRELHDYLTENIDIGIAMGTSCLEIGALGIPIALIDYSIYELPDDANYDWLYETKNFTLGNDARWGITRGKKLIDLIELVRKDHSNDIGVKCFEYVHSFHSLPHVAKKLITYIGEQKNINTSEFLELEAVLNPSVHSLSYKLLRRIKKTLWI